MAANAVQYIHLILVLQKRTHQEMQNGARYRNPAKLKRRKARRRTRVRTLNIVGAVKCFQLSLKGRSMLVLPAGR